MTRTDLAGKTFGMLTVTAYAGRQGHHGTWRAACVCGGTTVARQDHLLRGATQSCGCTLVKPRPAPRDDAPAGARWLACAGGYALVDADQYDMLAQWNWHISPAGYAIRFVNRRAVHMHRVVLGGAPPADGLEVDHKNRVRHDNRRSNLRWVTRKENCANSARWGKGHITMDGRTL